MEAKLNALIESVDALKNIQTGNQWNLCKWLDRFEKDIAVGQEEATQ